MKQKGDKTALKIILSIIAVVAVAAVIGWAFNTAIGPKKSNGENEEPALTMKVNSATGAEEYYDEDGKFEYQVKKEYADAEKKQLVREIYSDEKDAATKIVYYNNDAKTISRIDELKDGQVTVQHRYENGEDTGEYWAFTYNESGRQTGSVNYSADGKVLQKKEQSYNENNQPLVYEEKDAEGGLISKTEYIYDKKGNEIKTVFYNADGVIGYVEYKYEDGKKVRMDQYEGDELIEYRLFKYDKDGNIKEEIHNVAEEKAEKKTEKKK